MKIGIDARSILKKKGKTGIGYYTLNLINGIAKVDNKADYFLYSYIRPFDLKRQLPVLPAKNFHHRLDRIRFRPEGRMNDMDIFHTSSYDMARFKHAKLVTTIHDIIPLVFSEGYEKVVLKTLENNIKRTLDCSCLIAVDSYNTKKDLENAFSPMGKRIEVIYPGRDETLYSLSDKAAARSIIKKKYGIKNEFILYVGTVEKRKNLLNLLKVFFDLKNERSMPYDLVLIGMKGWGGEAVFEFIARQGNRGCVKMLGYINRQDLMLFYNTCGLFVYPSLYEGFGFPILEAFSCGAPTVASRTTSCGEIAGDAALTINPVSEAELKEAILKILDDHKLRESLKKKALERAALFSWEKTAKRFVELFNGAV